MVSYFILFLFYFIYLFYFIFIFKQFVKFLFNFDFSTVVLGGAGAISREFDPERLEYLSALKRSLLVGSEILRNGGSSLDACVAAVTVLEEEPLFNAGVGSVLTSDGTHELDAGVMRGFDSQAGS